MRGDNIWLKSLRMVASLHASNGYTDLLQGVACPGESIEGSFRTAEHRQSRLDDSSDKLLVDKAQPITL